jgi:membrane-associated protease RseP (regulator of RpoE activity)
MQSKMLNDILLLSQAGVDKLGILVFLLAITLVVTIHEFGHYLACRLVGIHVEKFGVGFGKPLLRHQREGGTEWSIRPWPLGGFIEPNKYQMAAASPLAKAFVAVAGPLANILPLSLPFVLLGKGSEFFKLLWLMYCAGITGVINTVTLPVRWLFSIPGIGETVSKVAETTGSKGGGELVGPIGIGHLSVQATNSLGFGMAFLLLFVILSLGLGLINLVPLPPLDGGRILLAGIETIVGKRRIGRATKIVTNTGVVIMLIMVLVITTRDIAHLF